MASEANGMGDSYYPPGADTGYHEAIPPNKHISIIKPKRLLINSRNKKLKALLGN